jgi:hypothetical protein
MRAVLGRAIAPATAALKNMQDAADHPTVVRPFLAAHVGRKQRLDPLPLIVAQPEQIPRIFSAPLTAENQQPILTATDLLGFNPRASSLKYESKGIPKGWEV